MNRIQGLGDYLPVSVRKTRKKRGVSIPLYFLCSSTGIALSELLPEGIARAYAKAINTYYAPTGMQGLVKPYKGNILIRMDIPFQIIPKSLSKALNITPDGRYIIQADKRYTRLIRLINKDKAQYTTYRTVGFRIDYPVWVEFVFHIKTQKQPTLADLCSAAVDMLAYIKYINRKYVVSLNNSRIVRDGTERTEIIVRELQERTENNEQL